MRHSILLLALTLAQAVQIQSISDSFAGLAQQNSTDTADSTTDESTESSSLTTPEQPVDTQPAVDTTEEDSTEGETDSDDVPAPYVQPEPTVVYANGGVSMVGCTVALDGNYYNLKDL